jgi:hypothetical protein
MQFICEKMRDVRTKINNGGDSELNFLNPDFFRNNLQFSVSNLQVFFKIASCVRGLRMCTYPHGRAREGKYMHEISSESS